MIVATELEQRAAIVAEAKTWLGTPYHHHAALKGVGVDCAFFLMEVFAQCGLGKRIDPGYYPPDWFFHRGEERYLSQVLAQAREIEGPPKSADVVLFKIGRLWAHGAIVLEWPSIIHAYMPVGKVTCSDADKGALGARSKRFFTAFGEARGQ